MNETVTTYIEMIVDVPGKTAFKNLLPRMDAEGATGTERSNGYECLCGIYRACWGRVVPEGMYDREDGTDWAYLDRDESSDARLKFVSSEQMSEAVLTLVSNFFCDPGDDVVLGYFTVKGVCEKYEVGFCDHAGIYAKVITSSNPAVREEVFSGGVVSTPLLLAYLSREAKKDYEQHVETRKR